MRIVSGTHKSRPLHLPSNLPVRPTTDFAKESLFNIVNNKFDFNDISVLDLFSGTGSISYEFASRGAKDITSVEIEQRCCKFINSTAVSFGFSNIRTIKADVFAFLGFCKIQYDIIFADPPYNMKNITELPDLVFKNNLLKSEGLFILEHSRYLNFTAHPAFSEHRNYGKVNFSFFR